MPMTPHYIQLALTLALMSGTSCWRGSSPIRSLGEFHVELGSWSAFTAALGMLIFASQLGNFLGIVSAPGGFHQSWCSERSGTWPKPSRGGFSWRPRDLRSARSRNGVLPRSHRC